MIQGRRAALLILMFSFIGLGVAQAEEHKSVPGEYVVVLDNNTFTTQSVESMKVMFEAESVESLSAESQALLVKRSILENQDYAIKALEANSIVKYAEPNYILTIDDIPNDPSFGELWGLSNDGKENGVAGTDINALGAWAVTKGSRDVVVGVIDTGVDYTHEDLAANMWTNDAELNGKDGVDDDGNGFVDDIYGYDFANDDGDPMDDHYHGTHVAGTIGAVGDNGVGVVGVAWNVKIMAIKFLTGSGSGTLAGAIKSIDYAVQMGATLTNNSWGGGPFTQTLYDSIERAKAKGQLFVAAAGNSSANMETSKHYPAGYDLDNIISVAAIDRAGALAGFSNYGSTAVDLGAPGVAIYSAAPGNTYKSLRGTSMASPHVAGAAALLYAIEPNISWEDAKARILETAKPLASLENTTVTGGYLNAFGIVTGQLPPPDKNNPKNWNKKAISAETAHPYAENTVQEWEFSEPGASQVAVYFERFETETGYDYVELYDAAGKLVQKMSGTHDGRFSPRVQGDYVKVVFKSDRSVNKFGFIISQLAFQ